MSGCSYGDRWGWETDSECSSSSVSDRIGESTEVISISSVSSSSTSMIGVLDLMLAKANRYFYGTFTRAEDVQCSTEHVRRVSAPFRALQSTAV